ncbi:MAG: hypothetical protein AABW92_04260 [Nanoarchaeota archaeon]
MINYYKIGMDFLDVYDKAEEKGELVAVEDISVILNDEEIVKAKAIVTSSTYAMRSGYIQYPESIKNEIVDYIPNFGWVLAKISNDLWR